MKPEAIYQHRSAISSSGVSFDKFCQDHILCIFGFAPLTDPPNITHITGNLTVNEGDKVTLNCTADGYPTPNITWTIGDMKKHFGSNFPLTITGKQDEGVYRCTADNGVGSLSSSVVLVNVQSKSQLTPSKSMEAPLILI